MNARPHIPTPYPSYGSHTQCDTIASTMQPPVCGVVGLRNERGLCFRHIRHVLFGARDAIHLTSSQYGKHSIIYSQPSP